MNNRSDLKVSDKEGSSSRYSFPYEPNRVILHLDVDCFEVQLWMKTIRPDLVGQDIPVVVIKHDQVILSVNYTAKSLGVKRVEGPTALEDARALCRRAGFTLVEITVGKRYGKSNGFFPMTESDRILDALNNWVSSIQDVPYLPNPNPIKIERTSRDEFYIDVTGLIDAKIQYYENKSEQRNCICIPSKEQIDSLVRPKVHPTAQYNGKSTTLLEGEYGNITSNVFSCMRQQMFPLECKAANVHQLDQIRLIHGALIANAMIHHIETETKYHVSAGVGTSKLIAKLACGFNKPKGICIITDIALPRLSKRIPFQKLPGFGSKTGDDVQKLVSSKWGKNVKYIEDILQALKNGISLEDVFQNLGFSDYKAKALDFYKKCRFKDKSSVTSKVYFETFGIVYPFKDCKQKDEFEKIQWNMSQNMKSIINYYWRRGRIAQELVIKADYINPSRSRECYNVIALPVKKDDVFISHHFVYHKVDFYIKQNGLRWDRILNIHLTAKNIIDG